MKPSSKIKEKTKKQIQRLYEFVCTKILNDYHKINGYQKEYVQFVCKVLITTISFSLVFELGFIVMHFTEGVVVMTIMITLLCLSIFLFRTKTKLTLINNIHLSICGAGIFTNTLLTGGILSPILPWLIVLPFIASFLLKNIYSWVWVCITVLLISFFSYANYFNLIELNRIKDLSYFKLFYIVNIFLLLVFAILINLSWNLFYKKDKKSIKKDPIFITDEELDYFLINWNFLKSKLFYKFQSVINFLDNQDYLTEHDKKYALLDSLKIDSDLLADKLNVSKRTVETNFYRVRKKLKHHKIDYSFLKSLTSNNYT